MELEAPDVCIKHFRTLFMEHLPVDAAADVGDALLGKSQQHHQLRGDKPQPYQHGGLSLMLRQGVSPILDVFVEGREAESMAKCHPRPWKAKGILNYFEKDIVQFLAARRPPLCHEIPMKDVDKTAFGERCEIGVSGRMERLKNPKNPVIFGGNGNLTFLMRHSLVIDATLDPLKMGVYG